MLIQNFQKLDVLFIGLSDHILIISLDIKYVFSSGYCLFISYRIEAYFIDDHQ